MVQDDAVYRCIGPHCGRLMPRRVNFCPWCGTAQAAQPVAPPAPPMLAKPPVEAARIAPPPVPPPVPVQAAVPTPAPSIAPSPPPSAPPQAQASPARAPGGRGIPPPPGVGRGAAGASPAPPPQRAPVKLRWWILALGALWLIWMSVRPEGTRIERRIDRAVALAVECKAREAQDELIALRGTRATPEQLRQVQQSLNKAAADCTRAEQRARAWRDAGAAIQKLRRAHTYDKALARLAVFTRRWGEDEETRKLALEIKDERDHPLADPTRGE